MFRRALIIAILGLRNRNSSGHSLRSVLSGSDIESWKEMEEEEMESEVECSTS